MRHDQTTADVAISAVRVRIPGPLRELVGGAEEVEARGASVGAVLEDVVARNPALRRHFRTERGSLRAHVNVYLNDEDIRWLAGEDTSVDAGDRVDIVPSIAGG